MCRRLKRIYDALGARPMVVTGVWKPAGNIGEAGSQPTDNAPDQSITDQSVDALRRFSTYCFASVVILLHND